MEIENLIKKMKDINSALIDYIETIDDQANEFLTFVDVLEKQKILENKEEIQLLFQLISKISDNHHRTSDFFDKLEKIFQYLIKDIPSPISYFIPDYTNYNKRILFLLLEKGFIKPDDIFLNKYLQSKTDKNQLYYYLYPKMKKFLEEKVQKQIEEEISQKYEEELSIFEEKCQQGENDSYICSLIRSDSVEDFISHFNRTNFSFLSNIKPTIYETHSFLIDKEPTLIEYASFFGSIQIIQYLKYNKVPLTSSLWIYAIHSNNAELIHFLEENDVKPENNKINYYGSYKNKEQIFDDVLNESIKCHHNAITDYIIDHFYEPVQTGDKSLFYDEFSDTVVDSLNFFFVPNEIESMIYEQTKGKGFTLSQLCFSLTTITIPSSVTKIGNNVFEGCSSLIQILIPSSVTEIGNYAFLGCTSLKQITIPSSVISIGIFAFYYCKSLTKVTIPFSVTSISDNTFEECSSLTQITIPSSVTSFGQSVFNGVKKLEIKGDIKIISNKIFAKCSSLTQITIPSSVISIEDNAFYNCTSLTDIEFEKPSSLKYIGKNCFEKCESLTRLLIPSSVTSYELQSFKGFKSLTQIIIPSSVTEIGNYAFCFCESLTQITIPSSVTSIGNYAFYGCFSLTQITIPSSVTEIGNYAFFGCSSLTQITIPSSVTSIGDYVFSGCSSFTQITIPSSVTSIGNYAFSRCSSLTQITIPSSVTSIGNNVFNGCPSLTF